MAAVYSREKFEADLVAAIKEAYQQAAEEAETAAEQAKLTVLLLLALIEYLKGTGDRSDQDILLMLLEWQTEGGHSTGEETFMDDDELSLGASDVTDDVFDFSSEGSQCWS